MKNVFKVFGIIALVAVIGFTMAACGGGGGSPIIPTPSPPVGGGSTLKIINEHTSATITKVTVIYAGSNGEREPDTFTTNTAPGQTWEQFISFSGYGMAIGVEIEVSGATIENYYRGTTASLSPGETKTLKLTDADGLR